jgi:hypothetical protein
MSKSPLPEQARFTILVKRALFVYTQQKIDQSIKTPYR